MSWILYEHMHTCTHSAYLCVHEFVCPVSPQKQQQICEINPGLVRLDANVFILVCFYLSIGVLVCRNQFEVIML